MAEEPHLISHLHQGPAKLYGREKELKILRDNLQQVRNKGEPLHIGFVAGESGTGKSALVRQAFSQDRSILYGSGKFEERHDPKPFAAILSAITEICEKAAATNQMVVQTNMAADVMCLQTLASAMPKLRGILGVTKVEHMQNNRSKEGLERLKHSLKVLLKSLASPEHPVVLCLDDLQWMDEGSYSILKTLLSQSQLKNCLFVGLYRSNEVNEDLEHVQWMQQMERDKPEGFFKVFTDDLTEENVVILLSDLLHLDPVNTKELASVVHGKTRGNIFHILQMVDLLESERLLQRSTVTFSWDWDISKIKSRTSLSVNIVDVVVRRMLKQPPDVQQTLKVCGMLGYRFRVDILAMVQAEMPAGLCHESVNNCVQTLIVEGFLERVKDDQLKFTHDRIHQAAIELVGTKDAEVKLHYKIGKTLWGKLGFPESIKECHMTIQDDRQLFVCVDQLNLGLLEIPHTDTDFRANLAELNNQASKRAASYSAFVPSLAYLEIGISLLDPKDCWDSQYPLSLDLYSSKAEICGSAGKLDECVKTVEVVQSNAKSNSDCESVEFILMDCLASQAKSQEQLETGISLLKKFGELVPTHSGWLVTTSMRRMHRLLRSTSDENILNMPLLRSTSPKAKAIQVISMMQNTLENSQKYNLATWFTCHTVSLTLEHGLAPYSAVVFASAAGHLIARVNDVDGGFRLAELAVKLVQKMGEDQKIAARVLVGASFVLHWRKPISITVDDWISSHKKGMLSGDIHAAVSGATGYGQAYFYSGLPLCPLLNDMESFCELMYDYG